MVFVVAPIYKSLIRNRAVAQAKTQSHLIEILSGIQTVKLSILNLQLDGSGKTGIVNLSIKVSKASLSVQHQEKSVNF